MEAIQSLKSIQKPNPDFVRGFWMCWLFIAKNIQNRITTKEVRESENLHYKINCLEQDAKILRERNESLKQSNKVYRDYFNKHNNKA